MDGSVYLLDKRCFHYLILLILLSVSNIADAEKMIIDDMKESSSFAENEDFL